MTALRTAIAFEAFGARIGIRAAEAVASGLKPRLPPRARPITTEEYDTVYAVDSVAPGSRDLSAGLRLTRNGETVGSPGSLGDILRELESDVHFQVALAARDFLFVHAGVVCWRDRAIVAPGRTETGKSSLVLALVQAGAAYFSDEYAVLDPEGRVHAYPKPLSQRRESGPPFLHPADALGGRDDAPAVPLGLTAVTRFRQGASWNPTPITKAQALMALFDNTVVARSRPEFALAVLAKAVESTEGLEGDRGEASETAAALLPR
jgi:hypothetical protein